jgi:chromate transport protein ChrA
MNSNNPTEKARRRYLFEFGVSIVFYVIVIEVSRRFAGDFSGTARMFLLLAPVAPAVLVAAVVLRHVRAMDEMQRRIAEQSLAAAGVITVIASVTWGLLEGEILPRPSAWWTLVVFMAGWLVATVFVRRRYE